MHDFPSWHPPVTFELGYLSLARVERTDRCCSSDNPVWYNLDIESGRLHKTYRLLYAWVKGETADALLSPAADQITDFIGHPAIPEVTIRLMDNRREDFQCGLYFLVIGVAYTWINARVIFPRDLAILPELQSANNGLAERLEPHSASLGVAVPKQKLFCNPVCIWLLWAFVPLIIAMICVMALEGFGLGLSSELLFASFLMAFFIAQAWIVDRLGINGLRWIGACFGATVAIGTLFIWQELAYQANSMSLAYSQGWLSIFGLIVGSLVGIFQVFPLKKQVAHAHWWILSGALVSETMIVTPQVVMALFHQAQTSLEVIGNQISDWLFFEGIATNWLSSSWPILASLWCFSMIRGAILIWMMLKDPAVLPVVTP